MTEQLTTINFINDHITNTLWLQDIVQTQIKDIKSGTLDERWDIFVAASKAHILPYEDWVTDITVLDDVSWYDDFYLDRYQLGHWHEIAQQIHDNEENRFHAQYDELREAVMQAGFAGFLNDW